MSERITEAELVAWSGAFQREDGSIPEFRHSSGEILAALHRSVVEVRRLRALIVAAAGAMDGASCPACAGFVTHHDGCPLEALEDEAVAIADEVIATGAAKAKDAPGSSRK